MHCLLLGLHVELPMFSLHCFAEADFGIASIFIIVAIIPCNFRYLLKNLNVGLDVFLDSFESLRGPGCSMVLSVLSEVRRKALASLGTGL